MREKPGGGCVYKCVRRGEEEEGECSGETDGNRYTRYVRCARDKDRIRVEEERERGGLWLLQGMNVTCLAVAGIVLTVEYICELEF